MNQLMKLADQPWGKVLGIGLIVCAVYYFVLFDNGAALDAQLASAASQLEQNEKTLKETQDKMKDLEKFRAQLSDQEAQVSEVMQFLPKDIDLFGLMKMVQDSAKQAGLSIRETKANPQITRKDFYEMQRVTITMQGTFNEITQFLSLVSKLPRLVTIDSIRLTSVNGRAKGNNPNLDFETTIVGYRYVDETPAAADAQAPGGQVAQ